MENSNASKNIETASDYNVAHISSVIMQRNLGVYIELAKYKAGGDIGGEKKK